MNFFKKILEWNNWEKQIIIQNYPDVQNSNTTMLNWLLKIGLFCFSFLIFVTLFSKSYEMMRMPYLIMTALFVFIMGISRRGGILTLILLYCTYGALMGIVTFTSSFITSDSISALALIILFQFPIVILDQTWRIYAAEILISTVYIIFMLLFKNPDLVVEECVNTFVVGVIGLFLGTNLRRAQLDNFNLKRQSVIRENTDELTGLYNRRKLYDCLMDAETKGRKKSLSGVVMIDIDNFKLYNDTYGHVDGDECLKKVSAVLHSTSREYPITFFRYGGEEFVGVTYEYGIEQLYGLCKNMAEEIYNLHIPNKAAAIPFVTISIGLTAAESGSSSGYEALLLQSDRALYEAKNSGKNKAVVYHVEIKS